jgi:catechol 2,3-dioxygenase-like lactoylglutathione lyase family enzyme
LRVDDLRELLLELRNHGVPVDRTRDYDYGIFAWVRDPEGNLIELFETA